MGSCLIIDVIEKERKNVSKCKVLFVASNEIKNLTIMSEMLHSSDIRYYTDEGGFNSYSLNTLIEYDWQTNQKQCNE